MGADKVIDYTKEDFTHSSTHYDFVYDTIGKSSFAASRRILKKNGVYLSPVLKFTLLWQMLKTSIFGSQKAKFEATGTNKESKLRHLLDEVLVLYRGGLLKTVIDRQFPLEKLAEAHRYIDTGRKKGNVVIVHH